MKCGSEDANETLEITGRIGNDVTLNKRAKAVCCGCFFEGKMTADNEIEIKEAFQRAQRGHNNKAKLVASLKSRYNKVKLAFFPFPLQCFYLFVKHIPELFIYFKLNFCVWFDPSC